MSDRIVQNFPLIAIVASGLAVAYPPLFIWFNGLYITVGLGIIMLGMGITLTFADYLRILSRPYMTLTGLFLQFTVMPLSGYFIARNFDFSAPVQAGIILVACCPGGTASNVITFLAKGDVALSVTMTTFSTMVAVILTPLLSSFLIGNTVKVDTSGLFVNVIQVVVIPLIAGALLNKYFHKFSTKILPFAPVTAVLLIVMIVASVIGASRDILISSGLAVLGGVFLLHSMGFGLGYILSKKIGANVQEARTISIEVGMQNSGLGVVLARNNFSDPLTAVPSALSSLTHSLIGSILAAWFSRKKV